MAVKAYKALPSQKKFHASPYQFRAMVGGLGSGKTTCGCREALRLSQAFPGSLGLIGRLTSTSLRDTTQRRFFEIIDEVTQGHRDKIIYKWLEGQSHLWLKTPVKGVYSEILFRHLDEPGPLGSLDLDWWWIDECHEPEGGEVPEAVFLMLRGRLRGVIGPLRGSVTSNCGGKDWIWKWFFSQQSPDNFWGITCPTRENLVNLPPNYEADLRRDHPQEWVDRFLDCSFDVFQGMIFEEFTRDQYVIPHQDIPTSNVTEAGFDFGVSAPTACLMAKITPNNDIYVYDEYYRPEADIRKVCEWIKRHKAGMVWADPSTRNRGPNKQSPANLYLEHGVILSPAPSNDALVRISAIHQYLMRGKLFFSDSCEVTIACLESSEWKPVKTGEKERPLKKEDHARDALAYLLLGHPLGTMLDAVKPGRLLVSTNEGNSFRHHSLDEDTDRQNEILSEEDWLNEFA
jgi:phage terminase large subunit